MNKPKADRFLFYSLLFVAILMFIGAFYPGFQTVAKSPWIIGFFSLFFFASAVIHSSLHKSRKFTLIFFTVMVLYSFSAEYAGTHQGIYYTLDEKPLLFEGETYYYADFLPFHILKVPVSLILMWPFIIYSAFFISQLLAKKIFARFQKKEKFALPTSIVLASLLAMLWDLSFDPLATKLRFWTWVGGGSAFKWIEEGIPVGNFTSWFLITLFSLLIFVWIMKTLKEDILIRKELKKVGKNNENDKTGLLLSLFLFLFIWTFSIPQKEYLFLIMGIITQLVPWWIVSSKSILR